jgi:hypothetical protein
MATTATASLTAARPAGAPVGSGPRRSGLAPTGAPAGRLEEESETVAGLEAPAIIFGTILAGILVSVLVLGTLWGSLALG